MKRKRNLKEEIEPHLYLDADKPKIYRKQKSRTKSVLKWVGIGLLVLIVILAGGGYLWLKSKESQMRLPEVEKALNKKTKNEPITTLVMGTDEGSVPGETHARADIIMLVSVNPENNKAAVISIPRDTRCQIPGHKGYNKINAAYALGGAELTVATVRSITSLPINHFAVVNFQSFKEIVDAIGGVPLHIDVPIHDKYAGDVPAGDVILNGDQALALARARHDPKAVPRGDLDRIENQRKLLNAMLSKVASERNALKLKQLVEVVAKNVKTDLAFTEMYSLGNKLKGIGTDKVEMATAPGESKIIGGTWYYVIDTNAFKSMLQAFQSSASLSDAQAKDDSPRSSVRVAVLNGCGKPNVASSIADSFLKLGYKEVKYGNAKSRYSKTTIYYSDNESSLAGIVAADLPGSKEPVLLESNQLVATHKVDVLVVLGSDYRED
ncbi:MAG: LCP family protein [Actinomycetota bacterium]|nr:LCP family protein [Actinomycetota bacterium]